MANGFSVQLKDLLDGFDSELKEATKKAMESVAKEAAQKLKNTSPKESGKYARGWKSKKDGDDYVVFNSTAPQLTHLLENGHAIRNQFGNYGRVRPIKHIQPVEEWANSEVVERIERGI